MSGVVAIANYLVRTFGQAAFAICIFLYACDVSNIIIAVNKGFVKGFVISETVL